jgi:hypothetical protein
MKARKKRQDESAQLKQELDRLAAKKKKREKASKPSYGRTAGVSS